MKLEDDPKHGLAASRPSPGHNKWFQSWYKGFLKVDTSGTSNQRFELYLLPIARTGGLENNQLDGLFTTAAPKRCQRARKADRLLLWLTVVIGQERLPREELVQWLKEAARIYFNARGSITAGLRECANALNARFLERGKDSRVGAKLNMAVLRGEDFYFGHAGAVYTFLLQENGMTPFFNTASHAQVLGYVDQVQPQFFQSRPRLGDVLLFSPAPAQGWNRQTLTFEKRPSLQSVRRRLLSNTTGDFESLVLQIQAGDKGEFHRMKLASADRTAEAQASAPINVLQSTPAQVKPAVAAAKPDDSQSPPAAVETRAQAAAARRASRELRQETPSPAVDGQPVTTALPTDQTPSTGAADAPVEQPWNRGQVPKPVMEGAITGAVYVGRKPARRVLPALPDADAEAKPAAEAPVAPREPRPSLLERLPLPNVDALKRRFAAAWLKLRKIDPNEGVVVVSKEDAAAEPTTPPAQVEQTDEEKERVKLPMPPRVLLFIAIAVPLIVAAVAGTVFFQRGIMERYTAYYDQAHAITYQAMTERDSALRKEKLLNAAAYLDEAEKYRRTEQSESLREEINTALDDAAGVVRVPLFDSVGSRLKPEINLTQLLLSNDHDLFALDSSNGQVLHFIYEDAVFQLDTSFNCGGGTNPIIDIALLPPGNEYGAHLLGIDNAGGITYCTIDAPPRPQKLSTPIFGWVQISGMVLEREKLYMLDSGMRAVWEYYGEDQKFLDAEPYLFFSQDAPLDLSQVKAMDVYSDTMAFVQTDDQVMTCVVNAIDAAHRECFYLNPIDTAGAAIDVEAVDWIGIHALDYPPSYYLMDQEQQTLYQFSVQMKLNKSFRFYASEGERLPNEAVTAFTVTERQWVLVAYGNQIFLGQLR
ncbi:MAG: hypothetical protein HPY85_09285 [Anaerolineae bacterium]|nr:hypothetical protein [Anaerolineae bacterium]